MVEFETQVYHKEGTNIIGAEVIVSAENGETIGTLQITSKTDFDDLVDRLNNLTNEFISFDENSQLRGNTIDAVLANINQDAEINATLLNGVESTDLSRVGHTHVRSNIVDLYNYDISISDYNLTTTYTTPASGTVTVKVTDPLERPVANEPVTIFKNGASWQSGTTNVNGIFTANFSQVGEGIITFGVKNQKVQCNVKYDTGWLVVGQNIGTFEGRLFQHYSSGQKLKVRKIGKVVYFQGAVTPTQTLWVARSFADMTAMGSVPSSFAPPMDYNFLNQASGMYHHIFGVQAGTGRLYAGIRNGATTMEKPNAGDWLNCFGSYALP